MTKKRCVNFELIIAIYCHNLKFIMITGAKTTIHGTVLFNWIQAATQTQTLCRLSAYKIDILNIFIVNYVNCNFIKTF